MAAALGDGAARPLQRAMKLASAALELDAGGRPREAYAEYLRSIRYISQALLEQADGGAAGDITSPDTSKMLRLAEQCLERAQSTATVLGRTQLRAATAAVTPGSCPASRHRRVCSDEGGKLCPFLPPEVFQKLQVVESQSSKKELTPLEEASVQNQKLKAAYEARMARLDPSQATQKTALTLSLQRQVMENLVIAKAREETLQRKMEERRLRLQEAANRRFCSQAALTPEDRELRALYAAILEYEQDHDWPRSWRAKLKRNPGDLSLVASLVSHLLSVPDHPISQLLRRLQCAVYRSLYPMVSCSLPPDTRGLRAPASRRLRPSQSLYCMLSPPEPTDETPASPPAALLQPGPTDSGSSGAPSPLVESSSRPPDKDSSFEDLEQLLTASEQLGGQPGVQPESLTTGVSKEPLMEQLRSLVRDIHNAIDRLLSLTLLAFEGLNTAPSKDRCLACLEEPFFSPLWPLLLALYRAVYRLREAALSRSMELYRNAPPAAVGIPARLLPPDPTALGTDSYPYFSATQELGLLVLESCPQRKLACIVRALRVICASAEDYFRAHDAAPVAGHQPGAAAMAPRPLPGWRPTLRLACSGADDLLPILSFVVLRSGLPQLVSECAALEEFIHEGCLIGEEGYCLTSLQSALSYVEQLPRGALGK
ncbi:VPS9 domain-containing protein 1 isoform X2 [Sorex araneus]|uniref:VPS9 domain-containing protein 1 isoform X2 n=1 Tax=Sorex araneus TaxID=42254 RepID=UPI00243366A7|nr:VPS9 domain-containing protein 1 isoform X2 [Sorex araneus]